MKKWGGRFWQYKSKTSAINCKVLFPQLYMECKYGSWRSLVSGVWLHRGMVKLRRTTRDTNVETLQRAVTKCRILSKRFVPLRAVIVSTCYNSIINWQSGNWGSQRERTSWLWGRWERLGYRSFWKLLRIAEGQKYARQADYQYQKNMIRRLWGQRNP